MMDIEKITSIEAIVRELMKDQGMVLVEISVDSLVFKSNNIVLRYDRDDVNFEVSINSGLTPAARFKEETYYIIDLYKNFIQKLLPQINRIISSSNLN